MEQQNAFSQTGNILSSRRSLEVTEQSNDSDSVKKYRWSRGSSVFGVDKCSTCNSVNGTKHNLFYEKLCFILSTPICALWLKKVKGLHNVPVEGGAILASNHESYLDFIILPVSGCRPPRYLVGEVFFEMPVISWLFRKMGFIQVDRRRTINTEAIRKALNYLKAGELIGIYPEGTRSPDGKLQEAHDGIAFLAHMSETPVIPVAVIGTYEAWPKGRRFPKASRCEVRFGEPLLFTRDEYKVDKAVLTRTTRTIMARIAELAGEEYPW